MDPLEAGIADLHAAMALGELSAVELTRFFIRRIEAYDRAGPRLNSVLEINPEAPAIAEALDDERRAGVLRGPLHGIPILLKDNIATADRMHTSAGSLALAGCVAPADAFLVKRLRAAGAVLLGKTNMTEWANYMTTGMPAGYSSRGGQVVNPHLRSASCGGSSSGSAVAVAAGLCAAAVGTETSGSILNPASRNAVVGLKPTVGLISRTGVIPIAASQDTAGPLARSVADAALLLGGMTGADPADRATRPSQRRGRSDYRDCLDPDGLRGARIGVPRAVFLEQVDPTALALFEAALVALHELGATLVDPADIATARTLGEFRSDAMLYEFKRDLNRYLGALGPSAPVASLRQLIRWNEARPEAMLRYGQVLLLAAEASGGTRTATYKRSRAEDLRLARSEGIDAIVTTHRLDALAFIGSNGAAVGAKAGYPSITVPAGQAASGEPVGLTLLGPAWSEPLLIRFAHAYEQATQHRRYPACCLQAAPL